MRVALLTYSTRPRGGVVHTLSLAEALAAAGAEVTVFAVARHEDLSFFRPVDPLVEQVVVPLREIPGEPLGPRVGRCIEALHLALEGRRFDVVHAQDCISANAAGRCIRTVHHLDTFTTPELVACHERAIVTPHTHVCVSSAVAEELRVGWGISATVIPNGVEAARFAAAASDRAGRAAWRTVLGAGPVVLAVGGIEPRKGTLELVEAVAAARRRRPDLRLVVAGGESLFDHRPYRALVDARCAALGVEPFVLGPVDHATLPALVAECDALAMPSTKEGFGLAAMEGLAAGVPVVLSRLAVFEEVFAGAAGFATGPDELAAALLDSIEHHDPVRTEWGRALAARHTWSAAADAHLAVYERVLSEHR